MLLLWILLGASALFALSRILASLRGRSGQSPPPGKATMADVERLMQEGQTISAIRCYREIHKCGLTEAKKAVDDLRAQRG